jgi:hypothetical protein
MDASVLLFTLSESIESKIRQFQHPSAIYDAIGCLQVTMATQTAVMEERQALKNNFNGY